MTRRYICLVSRGALEIIAAHAHTYIHVDARNCGIPSIGKTNKDGRRQMSATSYVELPLPLLLLLLTVMQVYYYLPCSVVVMGCVRAVSPRTTLYSTYHHTSYSYI
jgi:hypothetical protein